MTFLPHIVKLSSISERIASVAIHYPDMVAIVCGEKQLTYRNMMNHAARVANSLKSLGLKPEDPVVICSGRKIECIVGIVGIILSGGAYVPIDVSLPENRIQSLVNKVNTRFAVGEEAGIQQLAKIVENSVIVNLTGSKSNDEPWDQCIFFENAKNRLMYELFTSGSTGIPKLVAIEQGALCTLLDGFNLVAPAKSRVVTTTVCSFSFDVSVWEIFSALTCGGTVHILQPEDIQSPERFVSYLLENSVNTVYIPPFVLEYVIDHLQRLNTVGSIERILVGVEPILQSTLQKLRNLSPSLHIINGYGPTEATICASFYPFKQAEHPEQRTPIGFPVDGYKIKIGDESLNFLPHGVTGEIIISGAGLARGYANDAVSTNKVFVDLPGTGRWYRTGDFGRILDSGALEFAGRNDEQVKIRGYRVELTEIEMMLRKHPGVKATQVLAVPASGGRRLIAFAESLLPAEILQDYLKDMLPSYMHPSRLICTEKFPITENGKIDRKALLSLSGKRPLKKKLAVPLPGLQEEWARIWSDLLGIDEVGMEDSFYELGGDSMLALIAANRMAAYCGKPGWVNVLLQHTTLSEMAAAYEKEIWPDYPQPINQANLQSSVSFGQEGLWVMQNLDPANTAFVLPVALSIKGGIVQETLIDILQQLAVRHKVFRTVYTISENKVLQYEANSVSPVLSTVNERLSSIKAQVLAYYEQDAKDILLHTDKPPVRTRIIDNGDSIIVLFTMHHIAIDGHSVSILASDIITLISGIQLAPVQYSQSTFGQWQRSLYEGFALTQSQRYWEHQIANLPEALSLPVDYPRPSHRTYRGQTLLHPIDKNRVAELSERYHMTSFSVLFSLMGFVAYHFSRQKDFFVATPVSVRPVNQGYDDTVGYFVNLTPVRLSFSCRQTVAVLLKEMDKNLREARAHALFPFEMIVKNSKGGYAENQALFSRLVIAQDVSLPLPHYTGSYEIDEWIVDRPAAMYELTVFVKEGNGRIDLRWEFDQDIFTADTIRQFQVAFDELLLGITQNPGSILGDLLTPAAAKLLLSAETAAPFPGFLDQSIIDLFCANAMSFPNRIALECNGRLITYQQLLDISRKTGNGLIEKGIGPGTPVLVFCKRNTDFIVAVLSILWAGGYYIPIDERVPVERIKFIIRTANVCFAIYEGKPENKLLESNIENLFELYSCISENTNVSPVREAKALAYVMFTSGSTGEPKGVEIFDRGVIRLVKEQNFARFTENDTFILASNLAFDAATLEIWGALLNGGRLIIPGEEEVRNPEALLMSIKKGQVTAGFFNVSFFRLLISTDAGALRSMHTILVGGENVPVALFIEAARTLDYHSLVNGYGPTENTTFSCCYRLHSPPSHYRAIPVGKALAYSKVMVVDNESFPVPAGVTGEIWVGGAGLARGYIGNEVETARRFITAYGDRWYITGDLGRMLPSGDIEYAGRLDNQVKIRGFRIEMGEIEAVLMKQEGVNAAVVMAPDTGHGPKLEAYVETGLSTDKLRSILSDMLPDYMIPSLIITVKKLPVNANGKLDRSALLKLGTSSLGSINYAAPVNKVQEQLTQLFSEVLQLDKVGIHDRFFEIGGNSLLMIILAQKITECFRQKITPVDILDRASVASLAQIIGTDQAALPAKEKTNFVELSRHNSEVAIVGMAGRFPGAPDVQKFWELNVKGQIAFSDVAAQTDQVARRGVLDNTNRFDAAFFGITDREAGLMDAQQRVLLEVAQHALDDASINPAGDQGKISVYISCGPVESFHVSDSLSEQYEQNLARSPDFAATRISYRLNLLGESITVQTGCSSSLVAVYLACKSLQSGQSDIALAGGVSFAADQNTGYSVEDGMITSPSGCCRPFDASADGTVPGGGAGVIVLMRLEDAVRTGADIRAIIKGSAINNDGMTKVGFMAPSPTGQAEVIADCHRAANITAGSIAYVETHGTATQLGDAVEIEGLRRAFENDKLRSNYCALGSVKANFGHLDRAAGITGLIRAVLAIKHGIIPPMAGFETPNPSLKLDQFLFTVPRTALQWPKEFEIRRAGVSSFGVGGTNVHVVLEECPARSKSFPLIEQTVILPLSASTHKSLQLQATALANELTTNPPEHLSSIVKTLISGRRIHKFRTCITASSGLQAAEKLQNIKIAEAIPNPQVVMIFPGQGDAGVDGFRELYEKEPIYRAAMNKCAVILIDCAKFDIRDDLYADTDEYDRFADMGRFQPAMFAVQWSLAELWQSKSIKPDILLGHSLGQLVAATRAGVFQLEDALKIVALRGKLMQETEPGAMISIAMNEQWVRGRLLPDTWIAAVNGKELITISGLPQAIASIEQQCISEGITVKRLAIPRAAHSPFMNDAALALVESIASCKMSKPAIPILENISGLMAEENMMIPHYWGQHLTSPVQFSTSLDYIQKLSNAVLLIIGNGQSLQRLIAYEMDKEEAAIICVEKKEHEGDIEASLGVVGKLWSLGVEVDLDGFLPAGYFIKRTLPGTVFDHSRIWPTKFSPVTVPDLRKISRTLDARRFRDPGAWIWDTVTSPLQGIDLSISSMHILSIGESFLMRTLFEEDAVKESVLITILNNSDHPVPVGVTDLVWWVSAERKDFLKEASAVAKHALVLSTRIWVIVCPSEHSFDGMPSVADLAHAATRVAPLEYPGCKWQVIEVNTFAYSTGVFKKIVDCLLKQDPPVHLIVNDDNVFEVSYQRSWPDWKARPLRIGGCYVITGGTGRVAVALAKAIFKEVPATIILIGRRPAEQVKPVINELEKQARLQHSSIQYYQLDVCDEKKMAGCFDQLRQTYNRIDGVIHAAGFTDRSKFRLLADTDVATVRTNSEAKINGTNAILQALEPADADFVILCSSLSTILGGIGYGAYAAANNALNSFANRQWQKGDERWISAGWEAWTNDTGFNETGPGYYALNDDQGHAVFKRLLAIRQAVVFISTGDIDERQASISRDVTGENFQDDLPMQTTQLSPEAIIKEILQEVMGMVPQNPQYDLRDLGVESLTILQIVTRLRKRFHINISLIDAMRSLSLAGLSELIAGKKSQSGKDGRKRFEITKAAISSTYPTSSVQRRWLELMPEKYGGLDIAIEVRGNYLKEDLVKCTRMVIERHSGLRTRFVKDEKNNWYQVIDENVYVESVDFSDLSTGQQKDALVELLRLKTGEWFNVEKKPPFEVIVSGLGPGKNALIIHAHHVVFDGWSSSLFLQDLSNAIHGQLNRLPFQYTDYALAQTAYLHSAEIIPVRNYWKKHFEHAPSPTHIPAEKNTDPANDQGEVLPFTLSGAVMAQVRNRALEMQGTPFILFVAAYCMLIHELTGDTAIVIGTTAAGRPSDESEEIIGVFVNPLPLHIVIQDEMSLGEYLSYISQSLFSFYENQHYPLEDLVLHVPPFVGLGLNDTFNCYILYQNYWRPKTTDIVFERFNFQQKTHHKLMREFEIILEDDENGFVAGELWYRPSRFFTNTMQYCVERFTFLVDILSASDRESLLKNWIAKRQRTDQTV